MSILISIHDFNKICRVCLENKGNSVIIMTSEINCMIETCTSVQENYINNKMPQQICNECYEQLKDAYQFKQKYIQSTQMLTEIIIKTEIQTDNEENDEKIFKSDVKNENNCEFETTDQQEFKLCANDDNNEKSDDSFNDSKTQIDRDSDIENYLNAKIKKTRVKLKKRSRVKIAKTIKTKIFNKIEHICDICGRKFKKAKQLRVHKISHSNARPHECNVCHRTFKYSFTLATHMRVKHNSYREMCFICGKFILPGSFNWHLSAHQRANTDEKFKCDLCERVYTREEILRKHYQEKHTDLVNVRFYCDICNKEFMSKASVDRHKTYTHSDKKQFKCELCGNSYKMASYLKAHTNTVHKDLRPHTCSTCNKAFHTKSVLTRHMLCHTGERPYSCEVCGKSFGQNSVLKTHKRVHSK